MATEADVARDLQPDATARARVALSVESLTARYGRIVALDDLSITVEHGECVAMLGSNGAGKSTLLRAISGMIRPTGGTVRLNGVDVTGARSDRVARAGLAHVPEGRRPLPRLTVHENLRLAGFGVRVKNVESAVDEVYDRFPRLRERRMQKAGVLSGGEQQMLVIGRALVRRPRVLLLDEPSLGLSPLLVGEVFQMIGSLVAEGLTVLLVEQNVAQALQVARRGYVLSAGRLITSGTAEELRADPTVLESYLGSDSED